MRLATGETRFYFYAWRGGPRIEAAPGTPEFISLYHQAYASLLTWHADDPDCRVQGVS
jgi:hypothetical protein